MKPDKKQEFREMCSRIRTGELKPGEVEKWMIKPTPKMIVNHYKWKYANKGSNS